MKRSRVGRRQLLRILLVVLLVLSVTAAFGILLL